MRVLVSDSSVLIDLERGGFLEAVFSFSWKFVVPDLLYERELHDHGGERLIALGLRIADLKPDEVSRALSYRRRDAALSLVDTFALSLAASRRWTLLTGDRRLRDLARLEEVTWHGVLWVLDQFYEKANISRQRLHEGLFSIVSHPRCGLPKREVTIRLARFKGE
jgi:hypothetical protein